jgi:2,3-dihydroxybenzoate decarboxylase
MQRPETAAAELARAVDDLGMRGALVNGFSDTADQQGLYYDGPEFDELWAAAEARGVPIYLHPRNPLRSQRRIYEGRPELLGPTWAFGVETATHALRLITGGVFDRFPKLNVVLGHLGETLPFTMIRLEQRLGRTAGVRLERSPTTVLAENFHITTSGNYDTATFLGVMLQLGSERLLFSADYPFEDMADGATWFDALPISSSDRERIGRTNAQRLLCLPG